MVQDTRNTKYSTAVMVFVGKQGHATNTDILRALRNDWPELSATTVHRVTSRLAEHGELGVAPKDTAGNFRYDANVSEHHHFYCSCCDELRDIQLEPELLSELETSLGGCKLNGQLLINGACGKCAIKQTKHKEMSHDKNNSI